MEKTFFDLDFEEEDPTLKDPVYQGMVKEFHHFDEALTKIHDNLTRLVTGVEDLAQGLRNLSEGVAGATSMQDLRVASRACSFREAANRMARADAPHSAVAKLKRDTQYNLLSPISDHLTNNKRLVKKMEQRERRLAELRTAQQQFDQCVQSNLAHEDPLFVMAKSELAVSRRCFCKVDRFIFEWLYALEEHKCDILDSAMQTLKYVIYEFFASSAHAVSEVLPSDDAMQLVDTNLPTILQDKVNEALNEDAEAINQNVINTAAGKHFAALVLERQQKSGNLHNNGSTSEGEPPQPVDALSLSSLMSQGFDEGPARRALRLHSNDTQAALDWLIRAGSTSMSASLCGNHS